ncbi:MAG TPA: phosphoserine phosphatase SerB [Methylocella sp.]|nr:phosphoserine phosphatase SerB [Methylocella sp.]
MTHVATLVCDPALPVLTGDMLRQASEVLIYDYGTRESLGRQEPPRWLAQNIAADIYFVPRPATSLTSIADRLRAALDNATVDVVVQEMQGRRKKLLLADMDSTMIGQECLDELADEIGARAHIAAITERAMRGDIAFEPALRERVALLKGLGCAAICRVVSGKITLTPGGHALVRTMRAHGAHTVLVSGGFSVFTSVIADRIGFHEHRANELLFGEDGRLSGLVAEPVLGKDAKLAALEQLREKHGLSAGETLAVGDGANDLAMLEAAGLGIAYHAKPRVAAAAHARIDHGDLTALLYAQGYREEEFVTDVPEQACEASLQRSPP